MAVDKSIVLSSLSIPSEVESLLGAKQGQNRYHCYRKEAHAHGDKNASLSMSPEGYYKCHTCGVKGDFFQLYMDIKGIPSERFGEVLLSFARKVGMDVTARVSVSKPNKTKKTKRDTIPKTKAKKLIFMPAKDIFKPNAKFVREWLNNHYGISDATIQKYGIGWSTYSTRLFIPIPVHKLWIDSDTRTPEALVNIRKHDVMRYHCTWQRGDESTSKRPEEIKTPADTGDWKAVWNKGGGKVIGVRGHNSVYAYPFSSLDKTGDVWLVGGELKALLLNQLGIPAVTFTCGEGSYAADLLGLFTGRSVRIVYDIDQAGLDGAYNVAKQLANNGANVSVGVLPSDGLPSNGDITDYLRINEWKISALDRITWKQVDREQVVNSPEIQGTDKKIAYKSVSFTSLTEGGKLNQHVKVPALISGRGDTPYAVPITAKVTCPAGQSSAIPACKSCILPKCGFEKDVRFSSESVVDMTGLPKSKIAKEVKIKIGIPHSCHKPKVKTKFATVEKLVTVPTVDINEDIADSLYRHHRIYYISGGEPIRENVAYTLSGKIVGDPKDNKFTLATTKTEPLDGDVFSYKFSHEKHEELKQALWTDANNNSEVIWNTVRDLRDHVLYKYGQDIMIMVEWMSWFMPFQFNIGHYVCHKICPEIMILGPTRVGKSTMAKDLSVHFGAGRYADCGANATFVGLIGGNADIGNNKVFTWGLIPTSHGGVVILDEYNKLHYDTMGGLTNQKSSGIAERITNTGVRKTKAFVRYLTLCNPRGRRKLEAYNNPIDAAIEVVGTPQDLARIDFLFVAQTVRDPTILNKFHEPEVEHRYKRELARYHLKWAWSLDKKKIKFKNPKGVLDTSYKLSQELGKLALIAPAEAKFKVGRIAVAVASMAYSYDETTGGVIVTDDHVEMAYKLYQTVYGRYLRGASVKAGIMPSDIEEIFNKVDDWRRLRILSTSDRWSGEDLQFVFGKNTAEFKYKAQLEHCLVRRQGSFFIPIEDEFQELIKEYITNRSKGKGDAE